MNSISKALAEKFSDAIYVDSHGQDVFYVSPEQYLEIVTYLKSDLDVTMCLDVTAVDFLGASDRLKVEGVNQQRFEVVSNFISHKRNERVRLVVEVDSEHPHIESIANIFPGANFGEREVFDMFGIVFDSHPDLTRILMPDEWEGFPLRKDDAPARIPVNFTDDLAKSGEVN